MRMSKRKIVFIILLIMSILSIGMNSYAHSGRTDSNGGHKDNKNASGLGSYHYHCGGNPPHLHANGICPYAKKASPKPTTSNSSTSTPSSVKKTTIPSKVEATSVKINEKIEEMKIGENEKLTATITPNNTTNQDISWKSSNESIAIVNQDGEITAKEPGQVTITASTSNEKIATISIRIKEKEKIANTITKTSNNQIGVNNKTGNNISKNKNSNDVEGIIGGVVIVGLVGAGIWGYKKYKIKNNH